MADITKILGGAFVAPSEKVYSPPEVQLRDAIASANLLPPDEILFDGQIHRFKTTPKSKDKSGWYIGYADGVPMGRFGCWRQGIEGNFRADIGRKYTASEEMSFLKRMTEAKAMRDAEIKIQREQAANTVETIWAECIAAHPDHPYLKRKGIGVHGARTTGDGRLVVPLFDEDGDISSLQYISADGKKLYHTGGATGARYWTLGEVEGTLYVAEGFATAATIREATGKAVVVAYSASNLVPVTEILRRKYGVTQDIVIVADNDASGVGLRYAEQACAKYGARLVMPPELGDANDYVQAGHDLLALLEPPKDDWLVSADEFCAKPAPISWLLRHWLQSEALIMVHGQSGGGKTFVVLDWVLRIAAGLPDWFGNKVKPGIAIYLAGEGHHGLKARIAAWKQFNGVKKLDMWLSKDGCDLNTPAGYQRVLDHIRSLKHTPSVIVVDTLHRFLAGDENSAQDAKTMLDACAALMKEFKCSVLLVHHTGVSTEAQHRARGSSAWRGALDIEVSIVPSVNGSPIEIHQKKSKDAELAHSLYARLESVAIQGWIDEDGNQVTSAVLVQEETPEQSTKKESGFEKHRKLFENAWFADGAQIINNQPYISRSSLINYLVEKGIMKLSTAEKNMKPSVKSGLISDLIIGEYIEAYENGWIVSSDTYADRLRIAKNG